jgi:hypothetical protein
MDKFLKNRVRAAYKETKRLIDELENIRECASEQYGDDMEGENGPRTIELEEFTASTTDAQFCLERSKEYFEMALEEDV